jgi:hypothetical protein
MDLGADVLAITSLASKSFPIGPDTQRFFRVVVE